MAPINTGNTGHWQFMFRAADVSCGDGTSEVVAFEYPLPFIFHPDASTNLRLMSGRIVAIVCAQAEKIVSTMTDCIRDILFSSDSAVFSLFGRADFLPPLEIPGAATPQPILITTNWISRRWERLNASEGSESGVAVARGGVRMSCVGAGSPPQIASGHAG
jgi:hypothetical protein